MEYTQQTPITSSDPPVREGGGTDIASSDTPVEDARVPIVNCSTTMVAGSEYVATLPTVSLTGLGNEEADRQCVLCRETYILDPVILPCSHKFDRECLLSWLSEDEANQTNCPMCRRQLFRKLNLGNGGNRVYIEERFIPLLLHEIFDHCGERRRPEYRQHRAYVALQRRIGALEDRRQYELLRNGGANLPAVNPGQAILDIRQDHLLFQELQRRGAFALSSMGDGG